MSIMHFLRRLLGPTSSYPYDVAGTFSDIENNVSKALANQENTAILIIQVVDSEAFVQFSGGSSSIQLAFPIVTESEKSSEDSLRSFFKRKGLETRDTLGSDGTRFLDVDLRPDSKFVADIISQLLVTIYRINPRAQLRFMGDNLGVAT